MSTQLIKEPVTCYEQFKGGSEEPHGYRQPGMLSEITNKRWKPRQVHPWNIINLHCYGQESSVSVLISYNIQSCKTKDRDNLKRCPRKCLLFYRRHSVFFQSCHFSKCSLLNIMWKGAKKIRTWLYHFLELLFKKTQMAALHTAVLNIKFSCCLFYKNYKYQSLEKLYITWYINFLGGHNKLSHKGCLKQQKI